MVFLTVCTRITFRDSFFSSVAFYYAIIVCASILSSFKTVQKRRFFYFLAYLIIFISAILTNLLVVFPILKHVSKKPTLHDFATLITSNWKSCPVTLTFLIFISSWYWRSLPRAVLGWPQSLRGGCYWPLHPTSWRGHLHPWGDRNSSEGESKAGVDRGLKHSWTRRGCRRGHHSRFGRAGGRLGRAGPPAGRAGASGPLYSRHELLCGN